MKYFFIGIICSVFLVSADVIEWVDWNSATIGNQSCASGLLGSDVTVTYTGDISGYQLNPLDGTGTQYNSTNYWVESPDNPNGDKPYTGNAVIDNAPTANEMIAHAYAGTKTITFSEAVLMPVMAIISQGRKNSTVICEFNTDFTVLSEGAGFWGDGSYSVSPGNILKGKELHGVIQFEGLVTSISWESYPDENWQGFTFGAPVQQGCPGPKNVPEPSTIGMLMLSIICFRLVGKKRL